ncbi:protein Tob1-like [Petromyzon marinus]|uniref:Protein Tob1-like n=1 Tax=Petromyzon marinus TaxID=7757 RepID=A0AAJ7TXY3_PETMA|nr:protein Tob1-like [Petromyzon marinus]
MQLEIQVALNFIISYLYNKLPRRRVNIFGEELERLLREKYRGHWYPEKPYKGSGYRCVHVGEGAVDPIIERAARESGLALADVRTNLPGELSVWIDPAEVSYQIGEKGPVKVLYVEEGGETSGDLDKEVIKSSFNPEAQVFLPVGNTANNGSGGPPGDAGGTGAPGVGGGSSHSASPSPPSVSPTFLPRASTQPLTFTTAAFAATKFGSTKMKSSGRRGGSPAQGPPGMGRPHRPIGTPALYGGQPKSPNGTSGPYSPPAASGTKDVLFPGLQGLAPLLGCEAPFSPSPATFGTAFDLFPAFGPLADKPSFLEGIGLNLGPLPYSAQPLQPVIMAS